MEYGRALLVLEDDREADAAYLFAEAARAGAGGQAAWYAMAWSVDPDQSEILAQRLVDEGLRGPVVLPSDLLARQGLHLAAGLSRTGASGPPVTGWSDGFAFFPESGWVIVHGSVEAP